MAEMRKVYHRPAYLIVKQWPGGKTELMEGHFNEDAARKAASHLIGTGFAISLTEVKIIGEFIVEANEVK